MDQSQVESFNEFLNAFGKESDRGCAVLTLCVLEQALLEAVSKRMPVGTEDLQRNLAPPGRLGLAIDNAHLMGVLSKTEVHDFKYLAKVRNQFAHNAFLSLSFNDAKIKSFVDNLEFPKLVKHEFESYSRMKFIISASILYFAIISRAKNCERLVVADELEIRGEMVD